MEKGFSSRPGLALVFPAENFRLPNQLATSGTRTATLWLDADRNACPLLPWRQILEPELVAEDFMTSPVLSCQPSTTLLQVHIASDFTMFLV